MAIERDDRWAVAAVDAGGTWHVLRVWLRELRCTIPGGAVTFLFDARDSTLVVRLDRDDIPGPDGVAVTLALDVESLRALAGLLNDAAADLDARGR